MSQAWRCLSTAAILPPFELQPAACLGETLTGRIESSRGFGRACGRRRQRRQFGHATRLLRAWACFMLGRDRRFEIRRNDRFVNETLIVDGLGQRTAWQRRRGQGDSGRRGLESGSVQSRIGFDGRRISRTTRRQSLGVRRRNEKQKSDADGNCGHETHLHAGQWCRRLPCRRNSLYFAQSVKSENRKSRAGSDDGSPRVSTAASSSLFRSRVTNVTHVDPKVAGSKGHFDGSLALLFQSNRRVGDDRTRVVDRSVRSTLAFSKIDAAIIGKISENSTYHASELVQDGCDGSQVQACRCRNRGSCEGRSVFENCRRNVSARRARGRRHVFKRIAFPLHISPFATSLRWS